VIIGQPPEQRMGVDQRPVHATSSPKPAGSRLEPVEQHGG
jgi:hypothetical protein